MRNINGAQTLYTCEDVGSNMESELAAPVRYEKIILVLDDTGLLSFEWTSPMTVTAVENPDAALLPFPEIAARAMQQVPLFLRLSARAGCHRRTDHVLPCGARAYARRTPGCGKLLLPARVAFIQRSHIQRCILCAIWQARRCKTRFGGEDGSYLGGMYDGYIQNYGSITLNALDGSVIDKHLGY